MNHKVKKLSITAGIRQKEKEAFLQCDHKPWLTRKDIAALLSVSTEVIRGNEEKLGLLPAKSVVNKRVLRYETEAAINALLERKLLSAYLQNLYGK